VGLWSTICSRRTGAWPSQGRQPLFRHGFATCSAPRYRALRLSLVALFRAPRQQSPAPVVYWLRSRPHTLRVAESTLARRINVYDVEKHMCRSAEEGAEKRFFLVAPAAFAICCNRGVEHVRRRAGLRHRARAVPLATLLRVCAEHNQITILAAACSRLPLAPLA